jgi:hypothetical protein
MALESANAVLIAKEAQSKIDSYEVEKFKEDFIPLQREDNEVTATNAEYSLRRLRHCKGSDLYFK